jgi:hypothetical protein
MCNAMQCDAVLQPASNKGEASMQCSKANLHVHVHVEGQARVARKYKHNMIKQPLLTRFNRLVCYYINLNNSFSV